MPLQSHKIFLNCIYTAHWVFGYLKIEFRIVVAWWLDTLDTELMCRLGLTNHFTVVEFQAVAYADVLILNNEVSKKKVGGSLSWF